MVIKCLCFDGVKNSENCTFRFRKLYVSFSRLYKSMNLQVNAGIQNIFNAYQNDFDKGADRDSGYIYGPSLPRSFFAGVKISY